MQFHVYMNQQYIRVIRNLIGNIWKIFRRTYIYYETSLEIIKNLNFKNSKTKKIVFRTKIISKQELHTLLKEYDFVKQFQRQTNPKMDETRSL